MKSRALSLTFSLAVMLPVAQSASAHPHIFIDTGVEFLFDDQGRLGAVRVIWVYDELYSLLTTEEMALDPDLDGVLTDAERAQLSGFDMAWMADYAGDLYAFGPDGALELSGPQEWTADLRDGRIVTTHVRAITPRPDAQTGPIIVRPYDPSFYTAYSVSLPPQLTGAPPICEVEVIPFDPDAAYAYLDTQIEAFEQADGDLEMDYPAVGEAFSDEVRLTCAG